MSPEQALDETLALIEAAPTSAAALTLYALVNTLEYERAGCLFKLTKLRDLQAPQRPVAYGLMELWASGGVGDERWRVSRARMDRAIRGG